MIRMSLDIETLGTDFNSVVLSIGVAIVDDNQGLIASATIYPSVDEQVRSEANYSTLVWWNGQSQEARDAAFIPSVDRLPLSDVFRHLRDGFDSHLAEEVWGNGPLTDVGLIESMAQRYGYEVPWTFDQVRCLRTLRMLAPEVPRIQSTIPHSAEHDAIAQGLWAREMIQWLQR